jgi:hypothetical protein
MKLATSSRLRVPFLSKSAFLNSVVWGRRVKQPHHSPSPPITHAPQSSHVSSASRVSVFSRTVSLAAAAAAAAVAEEGEAGASISGGRSRRTSEVRLLNQARPESSGRTISHQSAGLGGRAL